MTVDEILERGRYKDGRGREWEKRIRWSTSSGRRMWSHLQRLEPLLGGPVYRFIDESQMRLLIERDQHRDECRGLRYCELHPVPHVVSAYPNRLFDVYTPDPYESVNCYGSFQMALNAARTLAVGE